MCGSPSWGSNATQTPNLSPSSPIACSDALEDMPGCAEQGKTAAECGDVMMTNALARMGTIIDGIHDANPNAKVVGVPTLLLAAHSLLVGQFGYDTMFGGFGCEIVTRQIFPQCWKNSSEPNPVRCFNTELVRMQEAWETLASTRPFVTAINLLGTTQVAAGDTKASIGKPNLDKMGPRQYWPDLLGLLVLI